MARIFRHSGTLDFQNVIFSKNSLFRKFGIPLLFLRFRLFAEKHENGEFDVNNRAEFMGAEIYDALLEEAKKILNKINLD